MSVSVSADISPYCSAHDEWLIMKLCIHVCRLHAGWSDTLLYLLILTMAVDNIVFRIIKGAF